MRLEYTTEPTETMQITTPLGTQHAIPIWRPIGERNKPVMVEVAPTRSYGPNRTNVRNMIIEYMTQHRSDKGFTVWDLSIGLNLIEDTVNQALSRNKDFFSVYRRDIYLKHPISGFRRKVHIWKLREEN